MDTGYAQASNAANAGAQLSVNKPSPELGKLKAAAERIGLTANRIDSFFCRFHGPQPETAGNELPQTDSYRSDLETLFIQIDRLEVAVGKLDSIG